MIKKQLSKFFKVFQKPKKVEISSKIQKPKYDLRLSKSQLFLTKLKHPTRRKDPSGSTFITVRRVDMGQGREKRRILGSLFHFIYA